MAARNRADWSMIKRTVLPIIIFVLLTFAGCSSQNDDGITRTEAAHTFDGYPVVYIVPDVSPEGFLAAYRALEVPDTENVAVKLSYDPVALDQACVDFVYMVREGAPFAAHIAAQHGIYTLDYAEKIGLGSRTYALSMIDDPFSAAALLSANQKAKSKI